MTAGTGRGKSGGRGRKKKTGDGSVRSGGKATVDGRSNTGQAADEGPEDEEEEGEGEDGMVEEGGRVDRAAERKNLAYVTPDPTECQVNPIEGKHILRLVADMLNRVLVDAFNPDQNDRYDMFRRVKLRKETVRRVCQVLPC